MIKLPKVGDRVVQEIKKSSKPAARKRNRDTSDAQQ